MKERVEARIRDLFEEERERWAAVDADLAEPIDALRDFVLGGGKRLRPQFCFWAFVGVGGEAEDPVVVDAGAALELLHAAALIHDDLIDRSRTRHGGDTIHVGFSTLHRTNRWAGAGASFGDGVAIILGDLALAYSGRLLSWAPPIAASVLDELRTEVNVGQYLDLLSAARGVDAPDAAERALQTCRYKSAKYTVERPLHLGAALAAPERFGELAGPLSAFGLPLGEAFQLRDDVLGVFGDSAVTGKPVGDDLREGKATLLAALAARSGQSSGAGLFHERFGAGDLSAGEISRMQELIESSGAKEQVEARIAALEREAVRALESLPLVPEALAALGELAAFVTGRNL